MKEIIPFKTELLVKELYNRGVSIHYIFAKYYEIEAMADGRTLTVADAQLAAAYDLKNERKPF